MLDPVCRLLRTLALPRERGQRPKRLPAKEPRVVVRPSGLAGECARGGSEALRSSPPDGAEVPSDRLEKMLIAKQSNGYVHSAIGMRASHTPNCVVPDVLQTAPEHTKEGGCRDETERIERALNTMPLCKHQGIF